MVLQKVVHAKSMRFNVALLDVLAGIVHMLRGVVPATAAPFTHISYFTALRGKHLMFLAGNIAIANQ